MQVLDELYHRDFYAWTRAQAQELRRMAAARINSRLDLAHLAEEVEDLGKSERDAVRSQVRRILEHLLKLQHSNAGEPRNGWMDTVADARSVLDDKLTPTLVKDVEAHLPRLYAQVLPKARRGLLAHGEEAAAEALPSTCPYDLDQIRQAEWWPPGQWS